MAIPENIEQLANDIRTKVYGRDVREALASGIEAAGSIANDADVRSQETETKQTNLEKKYDEQIANMSLENPSVAEVVDARVSGYDGQSYTTIGKRFDSVDAQLAQIESNKANQAEIERIDIQLSDRPTYNETYLRSVGININDFDEPTRQTFLEAQGINVNYVLGQNNVIPMNLSKEIRNKIGKFVQVEAEIQDGFYDTYQTGFQANPYYKSIKIPCNPNEIYNVDLVLQDTTTAIVIFYDATDTRLSAIGTGQSGTYNAYEFVVPANAASLSVTSKGTPPVLRKYDIYDVSPIESLDDLTTFKNGFEYFDEVEAEIQNGFYDQWNTGFVENSQYWTIKVPVVAGEVYNVDTKIAETSIPIVYFWNNSDIRSGNIGLGQTGTFTEYEFTIPNGVYFISITSKGTPPILRKKKLYTQTLIEQKITTEVSKVKTVEPPIYARLNGVIPEIMFHYNDTLDMIITFAKVGPSGLMQISHIYTVVRDSNFGDFSKTRTLFKNTYSDWVGPYKCYAVDNIDGDKPTSTDFTGGWHGYNGDQTGGATGSFVSGKLYVDGKEVTGSTPISGNEAKIVVVNRINGANTKKADGTGRNILEEKVIYTISPRKIDVTNEITALEDLVINEYYGIQTENGGTWDEKITFWDNVSRSFDFTTNVDVGLKSSNSRCDKFTVSKGENYLTAYIKPTGLGLRDYVSSDSYLAFSRDYAKAYFNLIKGTTLTLTTGQKTHWQGGYIFSYGNPRIDI